MYTAIPYRASTGQEQGFPCEVIHTGKTLFSLQGTLFSLQGFPFEKTLQGKPCFHYREWVCSVYSNYWLKKLRKDRKTSLMENPAQKSGSSYPWFYTIGH